jgi:putative lipase involved disintegration of autophagic bodies
MQCQGFLTLHDSAKYLSREATATLEQCFEKLRDGKYPRSQIRQLQSSFFYTTKPTFSSRVCDAYKEADGKDLKIYVTGHSLGGALATLCAYHLVNLASFRPGKDEVATLRYPRLS